MHSCPECGSACYCGGDIDDIDVGDEEAEIGCTHYLTPDCDTSHATEDDFEEEDDA